MLVELLGVDAEARQVPRHFEKVFSARHLEANKSWSVLCVRSLEVCSGAGAHATETTDCQQCMHIPQDLPFTSGNTDTHRAGVSSGCLDTTLSLSARTLARARLLNATHIRTARCWRWTEGRTSRTP